MISYIATRRKGSNLVHRIIRITEDSSTCPATYSTSVRSPKYCTDNIPLDIQRGKISCSFLASDHRRFTTWENETRNQEKHNTKCKNEIVQNDKILQSTPNFRQWTDDFLSGINQQNNNCESMQQYAYSAIVYWSKLQDINGATRAEKILEKVFEDQQNRKKMTLVGDGPRVTTAMYNAALMSWANYSKMKQKNLSSIVMKHAGGLLRRMEERFAINDQDAKPNHLSYNIVLDCLGNTGAEGIALAEDLLHRMELGRAVVSPDVVSYNTVIGAFSRLKTWNAAEKSEKLLLRMTDMSVSPDKASFNSVIKNWANLSTLDAARRAQHVLSMMRQLFQNGHHHVRPNVISFNTVIDAFANCGQADMANEILALMGEKYNDDTDAAVPNIRTYNTILKAYARAGRAKEAEMLLFKIIQGNCMGAPLVPDVSTFSTTIYAISKSNDLSNAGKRAEAILDVMLHLSSTTTLKPNVILFNSVITCWIRSTHRKDRIERAEMILDRMKSIGVNPDHITFQMLIQAWCQRNDIFSMTKAEHILKQMEDSFAMGNTSARPSNFSYECFITVWSKMLSTPGALQNAYGVLNRMEIQASKGNSDVKVDTISCNLVLSLCAKSADRSAPTISATLLRRMEEMFQGGKKDIEPDIISYTSVIAALSKNTGQNTMMQIQNIVRKVKELENTGSRVVYMDTRLYNAIMNSFENSIPGREGAQRAQNMLEEMEALHREGNQNVKPDVISYNTVLKAWAKSGVHDAAQKAQLLLDKMEMFAIKGIGGVKPDDISFNTTIDAWARDKSIDAPLRAQNLIHRMIELQERGIIEVAPTTKTFTGVLLAWSKSTRQDSSQKAEQIIEFMEKLNLLGQNQVKPDTYCYTILLNTYAKNGAATDDIATRSLQILERLSREFRQGNHSVCPDIIIFNTALNAIVHSDSKEKVKICKKVLMLMDVEQQRGNLKAKPDIVSLNSGKWAEAELV